MGNENAGGKDNYILILDFPYPLIFVMDRKLAFWLFSKTMLMLLFSFSCLETGAWKDDVTCSYSQEELELESRQSGHRIHSLLKA